MAVLDTNWHVVTKAHGRPAMSPEEKRARGNRIKTLRLAVFGSDHRQTDYVSQEKLGELAGISRVAMVKIEGGGNAASGSKIERGLARAFGIEPEEMASYLAGKLTVDQVLALRQRESLMLTKEVLRQVRATPRRWHAGTLLLAAERVRHLKGAPEGGAVRFLDELERGVPVGSMEQAEALVGDIETLRPKRARR